MRRLTLLLVAGLALPVTAQTPPEVPKAGDWSLSGTLFSSTPGSVLGFGRMITDRLALGLELDLRTSDADEIITSSASNVVTTGRATSTDHTFGPTLRWYGTRETPVSPYVRAKVAVGWNDSELIVQGDQQQYQDTFTIQGSLSLGAEWYPLRYLSIGGHAGLQWIRDDVDSAANGIVRDRTTTSWGTFRSGLEVQFYFR
jgi:hypothetical protein